MENLDVLKILQTGLPGLVFLLSVLSFRLLSQEQSKNKPNDKVIDFDLPLYVHQRCPRRINNVITDY